MLVKFLNSDSTVSTAIAGSYFKGDGWTGAYYDSGTGKLVFESKDGLGFVTEDLRVATGGASSVEWTTVLNKPTSFPPSAHTHTWAEVQDKPVSFPPDLHAHTWASITDKPTEFTPVSHNHTISEVTGLQSAIDDKADKTQILTQQQFRDTVAAMFQSGTHTNVSINYNSVAGTINLSAAGGGGGGASVSEEEVQDWVGNLITQGTGISVSYDDVGNVLSIGLSGVSFTSADKAKLDGIAENATANSTDSQLRDRSTHTGTQAISTISGLQTALDSKLSSVNWSIITNKPAEFTPAAHTHAYGSLSGIPSTFPPEAHNHSWAEITGKPVSFTPSTHTHTIAQVTNLQTELNSKLSSVDWGIINNKPTEFTPATHTHAIANTTGLQDALDAKLSLAGGTMTGPITLSEVRETQASLGTTLTPDNGTVQIKTLTGALTLTEGAWDDGQAVVVTYSGANTHAITHPVEWKASDGFPSTMKPVQEIVYRKVGGVIRYSPGAGWSS